MSEPPELRMLRDSVRRLIEAREPARMSSAGRTGRSDPTLWREIVANGWLLTALDERHGGFGDGVAAAAALMEEAGRGLLREPLVGNLVALGLVAALAPAALGAEVIERVTSGAQKLAFACAEPGARFDWEAPAARLAERADGFVLDGRKIVVLGGADADLLVTFAADQAGDFAVLLVPAQARGVSVSDYALVDGSGAADIVLHGLDLLADAVIGRGAAAHAAAEEALDRAAVLVSAAAVGAMRRAFELTLDHVKQRVQFGEPIGRNQALQHRLVDLLRMIRESEILLADAVDAMGGEARERQLAVSALRIHVTGSARKVGQEAVQMHGAIGTTDEAAISHYFRALMTLGTLFGDAAYHRARYARVDRADDPALLATV